VVEDEQPHRLVAEQERDEVDGPEPQPQIDVGEVGGGLRPVEDDRPALMDRADAEDRRVLGNLRNSLDQLRVQVPVRREAEGVGAGLQEPQRGDVGAEQLLRRIEDVLEHVAQLEARADLGDDPPQRGDPGLLGASAGRAHACRPGRATGADGCAVFERERHAAAVATPGSLADLLARDPACEVSKGNVCDRAVIGR
jgi:hypothetical protein